VPVGPNDEKRPSPKRAVEGICRAQQHVAVVGPLLGKDRIFGEARFAPLDEACDRALEPFRRSHEVFGRQEGAHHDTDARAMVDEERRLQLEQLERPRDDAAETPREPLPGFKSNKVCNGRQDKRRRDWTERTRVASRRSAIAHDPDSAIRRERREPA
jgi:hypothetical protein